MKRTIVPLAVSVAVIIAAVAAIVVTGNRKATAVMLAQKSANDMERADAEARTESARAQAEADAARKAEASAKAAADSLAAEKLAKERAQIEERTAQENRKAAEAEATRQAEVSAAEKAAAEQLRLQAQKERDERAKAEAEAKAKTAEADAKAAERDREQAKADRAKAEAQTLELQKIDFETAYTRLVEWESSLQEREDAITPDKTAADLEWVGGEEDSVLDEDGNVTKLKKVSYDPENDPRLSAADRELARVRRLRRENDAARAASVRERIVGELEALYLQAKRENRSIDANYYYRNLKTLYPDWEPEGTK